MKEMVRQSCTLALTAVLAFSLGKLQMVAAQVPPQGNQNYGTFGNRTLGQPLVPAPSTFGGGIQTAPGGSFLGRSSGPPASATPGPQNNTRMPASGAAAQPVPNAAVSLQSFAAERDAPELPSVVNLAPLSVPATNGPEGTARTPPALGPTPASPRQPYSRSAELSDRMTHIARGKDLLFGPAIDVYVSNHVALIQGAVGTPGDATQLATALAYEPGVLRVDSRLVALRSVQPRPRIPAEATVLRATGSRRPAAPGPGTRQAQKPARPPTRQYNSPLAPSRLPIRPRTPRPSATRWAALPLRSRRAITRTFVTIAPGQSASARAPSGMRSNTGFIRAFTRLPVRTTVGNCTTASCHEMPLAIGHPAEYN
jgi:hypothetical protein